MPNLIANKVLPWRRFWTPWEGKINCGYDGCGFLVDPEDEYGKFSNPHLCSTEELERYRCVILSGQPGLGKTVEVEKLEKVIRAANQSSDEIIAFHCRSIASDEALRRATIGAPIWKTTFSNGGFISLIIDGVDEGLAKVPEFVFTLAHWLRSEPIEKIRLILVCRTAEWDITAGKELMSLWPQEQTSGIRELCPLRYQDADFAARESNINSNAFLKAVQLHRVSGLAARPLTLRMLIDEFDSGKGFPNTHRELYERAAFRMCAEIDDDRARRLGRHKPSFTQAQIFRVICRAATLLMLCGKNAVYKGPEDEARDTDLLVSDLVGGIETANQQKFEVTKEIVERVIETPHFSARGPHRYGFDHQTFAECLTAEYLRDLSASKLRKVLCHRLAAQDYVVPSLSEVAAWLGGYHQEWCDFLIESQPEVLLRTDITQFSDDQKKRVVAALLARADREELFDEPSMSHFYHTLGHPSIAAQLERYINNPRRNVVVRRMAIKIAGDAKVADLEADLWRLLKTGDAGSLYSAVSGALADLTGAHSRRNLLRALRGTIGRDDDDDLKGMALQKVVPELMSVGRVIPYLTPTRKANYFGLYDIALRYHLPKYVTERDLPALLRAMRTWTNCFDTLSPLHNLAETAFSLSLAHLDNRIVRRLLVELWIEKSRIYSPLPGQHGRDKVFEACGLANDKRRRRFVGALLNSNKVTVEDVRLHSWNLLDSKDLRWLLKQMPKSLVPRRIMWAHAVAKVIWGPERSQSRALLLRTYKSVPELKAVLPKPKRGDIDTTLTRLARAEELRIERRQKRLSKNKEPTRRELLDAAFRTLRTVNSTGWVGIVRFAYMNDAADLTTSHAPVSHFDITTSPGWPSLTAAEKREAKKGARRFLMEYNNKGSKLGTYSNYAEAAYHAISLLKERVKKDASLRKAIRENWITAIIDHWNNDDDKHAELVSLVYRLDPNRSIRRLILQLRHNDARGGYALDLRPFRRSWDHQLSRAVEHFLLTQKLKPRTIKNILALLAVKDRDTAVKTLASLLRRHSKRRRLDEYVRALVVVGLFSLPEQCWRELFPKLSKAPIRSAQKVLLESAYDLTDRESQVFDRLSDRQIGDLYLLLARLFPPEKFFERNAPDSTISARHEIPDLRDGCLRVLAARATEGSCAEINRIIGASPQKRRIWLRWRYSEALKARLRKLWALAAPSPKTILQLARLRSATVVHDEADFIEAILESLQRLQEVMHAGEFPRVRALWNEPPKNSARPPTPKEETALSDLLHDWLQQDLGPNAGVVVNRETQVNRIGKMDIKVEALPGRELDRRHLVVIIEVKRDTHRDLATACEAQLIKRYLRPNRWTCGVYVVGWFGSSTRLRWNEFKDVAATVQNWTETASKHEIVIRGFALDCRLHQRLPSARLSCAA